jgi:4-aminobutyrate aminotransferase-like enzyme
MRTRRVLELLRTYESRNVTRIEPDYSWPIVWQKAKGNHVWDADGRKYVDLTAAFGVAATGHANPQVVRTAQRQASKLLHAMGDVYPHPLKAQLVRELSRITFERWSKKSRLTAKTILCNSGFEAVEAAMKTALLATGKPGVLAFRGAYHGLGYGALNTTHRRHFRQPFGNQLRQFGYFVPFPASAAPPRLASLKTEIRQVLKRRDIGAILVEPVQVRGGIHVPPLEFLPLLRRLSREHGCLLILDEIYTGFGRTGKWFACEHSSTIPDIICLGKALTGGFPLSACVGRSDVMDRAWPVSSGEAIHTSTFLGHPVGCAMALAQIEELRSKRLITKSARLGEWLLSMLNTLNSHPAAGLKLVSRGLGLLAGIACSLENDKPATKKALAIIESMLDEGFILLPEGEHSNVISFTPPLTITARELTLMMQALTKVLNR